MLKADDSIVFNWMDMTVPADQVTKLEVLLRQMEIGEVTTICANAVFDDYYADDTTKNQDAV